MPAPLQDDAVAYLKQQNMPVTTASLNRAMGLLGQQPNLRPSYAGMAESGELSVDPDTMKPIRETGALPKLDSNDNSFGSAFKSARKAQGAGGVFDWNGKKYNTNYKEEVGGNKVGSGTNSDGINQDEAANIQDELAAERQTDEEQAPTVPMVRRGAGRAGSIMVPQSPDQKQESDMSSMIGALIGGGTAAGIGAAVAKGQKEPASYRQPAGPDVDKELSNFDDIQQKQFIDTQLDDMTNMKNSGDADFLDSVINDDYNYVDAEREAAKAAKAGDTKATADWLKRLPKGTDKKLIAALKAIL